MIRQHGDDTRKGSEVIDIIAEYFRRMAPQEKDRLLQIRLAEARGPKRNAKLLFDMTDMLLRARRLNQGGEQRDGDESNL